MRASRMTSGLRVTMSSGPRVKPRPKPISVTARASDVKKDDNKTAKVPREERATEDKKTEKSSQRAHAQESGKKFLRVNKVDHKKMSPSEKFAYFQARFG